MKPKAPKGVYKKFAKYMRENGITAISIAESKVLSPTHLSFILKGERPLTEDKREFLNKKLNTNF